jgi:hypothetical protein
MSDEPKNNPAPTPAPKPAPAEPIKPSSDLSNTFQKGGEPKQQPKKK